MHIAAYIVDVAFYIAPLLDDMLRKAHTVKPMFQVNALVLLITLKRTSAFKLIVSIFFLVAWAI